MKPTLSHIIGYIVGGLGFLAGLNQAAVTAVFPTLGPYVAPVAALAGALLLFLHNVGAVSLTSPPPASSSTSGTTKASLHWITVVLVAALVVSALAGCSLLAKLGTPAAQPYVTAAVDVAVATAEAKGIPAAQINSICKTALAADSGTAATLATVSAVVNAQLAKLKLPAGDLAAAQILEDALSVAIQAQVGANPNVATAQAAIADVLNAAIAATGG